MAGEQHTKKRIFQSWFWTRLLIGACAVGTFAWCMAGSPFGFHARVWKEGHVALRTIYAPFHFSYQDQQHVSEVEQGELIVSKGERLTATHVARLNAFEQLRAPSNARPAWMGALLLSILLTVLGAFYLKRYEERIWTAPRQLILVIAVIGGVFGLMRVVLEGFLSPAWIPVTTVAMLLGMLLNPRLGILTGLLTAVVVGLAGPVGLSAVVSFCVGSFVGVYVVQGIRRRIDFFRAGLLVGIAQAVGLFAANLLVQLPLQETVSQSLVGLGGGILAGLLTFFFLPLCELVFGLVTDVTLVELSDLNHPLLKELSVKAPGTYHHSLIVANLAEAACEVIGANALLARVGCYFHDIGKMLHPEYFVENQPPKTSRHDRLQPSMSSLVILNHVKDGIELAQKHHLNPAIIDFIPGHHGTGLIYYFYRRALEEVEDENLLKEERFRYPGPKPHSRETAVALLSDSVEAATRAQQKKSPARIQEVVRRIINNKFIDGQLNDCDLTLRDLDRIAEAFQRVLTGIYHTRIEYPKLPGEETEPESIAS